VGDRRRERGLWPLTHVGKYQGDVVVANILDEPRKANYEAVPRVVYTDPQAAAVGAFHWMFADTIQPFPTFSEIYIAALKTPRGEITASPRPSARDQRWRADGRGHYDDRNCRLDQRAACTRRLAVATPYDQRVAGPVAS